MKQLQQIIEAQGLSTKEAMVYLSLLELGEASVAAIASRASVKRPTAYLLLEELQRKSYVTSVTKGRSLCYSALNPYSLLEERYQNYKQLEEVVPVLSRIYEQKHVAPEMRVFSGADGLRRIMQDTLKAKTDILAWADIKLATETLGDFYQEYVRQRVKRGIWARAIFADDATARDFRKKAKEELREVYLVPRAAYPFKNEINIYDDKIAVLSHADYVGVIIQNKNIADTQRAIFRLGFEYAKLLSKQ